MQKNGSIFFVRCTTSATEQALQLRTRRGSVPLFPGPLASNRSGGTEDAVFAEIWAKMDAYRKSQPDGWLFSK